MFRVEDLVARFREQPFRPVRLIASEGLKYDVYHPDLVMIGERDLIIGLPSKTKPMVYQRVIRVALIHLVGIEDLPETTPSTNGPA